MTATHKISLRRGDDCRKASSRCAKENAAVIPTLDVLVVPWSDDEAYSLDWIVTQEWCWQWPGWKWVANRLNRDHGNNRTPAACRRKFERMYADV